MKLIGITGGVGMGKSTAQSILQDRAIPVIDTDTLARVLVAPGQPALREIVETFGPEVILASGELDRNTMAQRVFADSEARCHLEAILHPRIRDRWMEEVDTWRGQGHSVGAVVIPLLFETEAGAAFTATVCVACSRENQKRRLLERGWDEQQIRQRIGAQWAVEKKVAAADYLVWTDGELSLHAAQWDRVLASLQ
jgi:dephospho-CoA kinase